MGRTIGVGAIDVTPSARRLTESLRDIGYEFVVALADIVDNSLAADASKVDVEIVFEGDRSYVVIADDGHGMSGAELTEALRFGSRRRYARGDLGRYGLGLKTASISQCRQLTVVTRRALVNRRLAIRSLDLDHIRFTDRWEITDPSTDSSYFRALEWLDGGTGTVVLWEKLDRVLPDMRPEGGWARRRLEQLAVKAREYLGMVFHRFLDGEAGQRTALTITVNGEKVEAWNPFASAEEETLELPPQVFEVVTGDQQGQVVLHRYVLPAKSAFSSVGEFDRLSGPLKWNRQQGLYVYRANRLIQGGGWSGIRAVDEHTKLARASLDFQTDLDVLFRINVAKVRVALPPEIRTLLERPVNELCHLADSVYRRESTHGARRAGGPVPSQHSTPADHDASALGAALMSAALEAGEHNAFMNIMDQLATSSPNSAVALGW